MELKLTLLPIFLALGRSQCSLNEGEFLLGGFPYFFGSSTYECWITSVVLKYTDTTVLAVGGCESFTDLYGVFFEVDETALINEY